MAENTLSLDEFKARLPIVEVVGRHVRLTRRGREHLGLCPFHQEKTPSFTVSEAKGFYHCFGCGQHGNAIDFVMALDGLDFAQAITKLAELTGVPAPPRGAGRQTPAVDAGLYAANEAAARWFAGRLAGRQGSEAAAYLSHRGLDADAIARFGLGYAPAERRALRDALLAEGYGDDQLVEVGLLVQPEDGGTPFDRFRHRLMFPIQDGRGRIVGFGGRALAEARAKYLNTPDTPLFHKRELLYGLSLARTAVREHGTVIVAEGYMDVIALARAGLPHAVAPLGTAVSETQLALLWQLTDEPIVCLDGDDAGLRAAHRLVERALPMLKPGKSVRFALLPAGSDPDDLLRTAGRDALRQRLDEAIPLIDFLWRAELAGRNLDTPERLAALKQRFRTLTQSIQDRELGRLFQQSIEARLKAQFAPAKGARRGEPGRPAGLPGGVGSTRLDSRVANLERTAEQGLLAPIVVHPELLHEVEEEFAALEFATPELEQLRRNIISWYSAGGHLDLAGLSNHLSESGFAGLVEQLLAQGLPTAWYRCNDGEADVLEGWRARFAERQRFSARRAVGEAVADAIARAHEDEGRAQSLAADRLLNDGASGAGRG